MSEPPRLRCTRCEREEPAASPLWRCVCGAPFRVDFQPALGVDVEEPDRPGLWRYRQALPVVKEESIVTLGEGATPLVEARIGKHRVLVKCEFMNPTGSYKDRGWTVAVSKLREHGVTEVVEDSTGNAGASLAAYGARAGIAVTIYVPSDSPVGKRAQIRAHGGRLVEVPGGRDAVAQACISAADDRRFYVGHAWNPWFLHGTRTLAWEIAAQCRGVAPSRVFTPVGQGCILIGLYWGYRASLRASGAASFPALMGVQAAACAPLVEGLAAASVPEAPPEVRPRPSIADGIRTPAPVRWREIVEAVRLSRGAGISVDEDEIRAAQEEMAAQGFWIEPTSAVAVAGARRWLDAHPEAAGETVVILTGHGLKTGSSPPVPADA